MIGEDPEQIPAFAGAHADDTDGTGRSLVERLADPLLDREQAVMQGGVAIVGRVPRDPVSGRHSGSDLGCFVFGVGRLALDPAVAACHASMSIPAHGS